MIFLIHRQLICLFWFVWKGMERIFTVLFCYEPCLTWFSLYSDLNHYPYLAFGSKYRIFCWKLSNTDLRSFGVFCVLGFFLFFGGGGGFFVFLPFLGPNPRHIKVPRLEVQSEVEPLAYATATTTPNLSHVCNLHHSSQLLQILNPLSKARDQTCNLMVPGQIH